MEKITIQQASTFLPHKVSVQFSDNSGNKVVQTLSIDNIGKIQQRNITSKLFLYDLSCLTKEIEHNNERFIPIVELAKICQPKLEWKYDIDNRVTCADGGHGFKYIFFYSEQTKSFHFNSIQGTPNQWQLFQKLYEWKIDFTGLIERELAIDATTLEINPYL